jgi:beta-glucanase (GH16 family)
VRRCLGGAVALVLLAGCVSWNEQFHAFDQQRWYPQRSFADNCSFGPTSRHLQVFTDRFGPGGNLRVVNDVLEITARHEQFFCQEDTWRGTRSYTSGWMQTGGADADRKRAAGAAFTYGYVDVRFRFPRGFGLWPAIWLLPASGASRPEIDMLETLGQRPNQWKFNVHLQGGVDQGWSHFGGNTSSDWHTIGLFWTPRKLVWVMDGKPVQTYSGPNIPREPMYLVLNLGVDGSRGTPDPDAFPATMRVDRVSIASKSFSSLRR